VADSKINPTDYDAIPTYPNEGESDLVHAVIETPAQMRHKYAFVPKYGIFMLKQNSRRHSAQEGRDHKQSARRMS
jgi:hypothetical protein